MNSTIDMCIRTLLSILLGCVFSALAAQDIYDVSKIPDIRIYFKESNWREVLSAMRDTSTEARLVAEYVVIGGKKYAGAGVRFKGNSSFNNVHRSGQEKLPLNIKLNHTFSELALPSGHTTFKLANGFRDPSMVREILAYEIVRNYMPAPRATFARVYINDVFQGVYTNVESIDKTFLANRLGENAGSLVKGEPDWQWQPPAGCLAKRLPTLNYLGNDTLCYQGIYEAKGEKAWAYLQALARNLESGSGDLSTVLNVDQALWMLALNNVMVNLDSYIGGFAQNYYLYFDTLSMAHPLIWDLNLAFGGFRLLTERQVLDNNALQHLSLFIHHRERNADRPLILRLLDDELLRKVYVAHCKTILEDFFFNGKYKTRIRELQQLIAPFIAQDQLFLYDTSAFRKNATMTVEAHGEQVMGIEELMEARIAYFKRHPLMNAIAPVLEKPVLNKTAAGTMLEVRAANASRVWLFSRLPGQAGFTRSPLRQSDSGAWQSASPLPAGARFYLVAENEATAVVLPRRGSTDPFITD